MTSCRRCPGCGHHLPKHGGLTVGHYRLDKDQEHSINGMQPDTALELAANAISFWVSQERVVTDFHRYKVKKIERRAAEMQEEWRTTHAELQQEIARLRQGKDATEARNEELKHELQLLQEKHQEETHKACSPTSRAHSAAIRQPARPYNA